jgi:large subunit ribosomal protein L3
MKFILAKKLQMTQIFDSEGKAVPVTLVEAGPCFVTQVKDKDGKDGYSSIQVGFGEIKEKKLKKPQKGHLKKAFTLSKAEGQNSNVKAIKFLREFRTEAGEMKLGDEIKADVFKEGDKIKVIGISKGKGFAGVVKRHGFRGGPASHGQKHRLRAPGSIGATFPERVIKGMRMAGRMGGEQVTVEGLKIAKVDAENNIIAIKGAVPGNRGQLLEIVSE